MPASSEKLPPGGRARRENRAPVASEPALPYPGAMQTAARASKANGATAEAPRYQQIYDDLRNRIAGGAYPVGSNLPTEVELCAEFEVSRYTVREALRRLVEQGFLARRQGSGSEVVATEPHHGFVHNVRSLADLFQYALDTYFEIKSMREIRVGAEIGRLIGGDEGSEWLLIKGIRRTERDGDAICVTHSYIPARLAWIKPEIPGVVGPFYALLEKRAREPIVDAVQEINAEPMTRAIAEGLDATTGDFALRLLRRYSSRKGTLVASFNWHDARDFTYRMQLQRSKTAIGGGRTPDAPSF
jgi:GntR family transcriptional regulator